MPRTTGKEWMIPGKENKIVSLQLFVKEEKVVNIRNPIKNIKMNMIGFEQ